MLKRKIKVKSGQLVKVIAGDDKNKTGTVLAVCYKTGKVKVEGVAVKTKHQKPSQTQEGGLKQLEAFIDVSNVKVISAE